MKIHQDKTRKSYKSWWREQTSIPHPPVSHFIKQVFYRQENPREPRPDLIASITRQRPRRCAYFITLPAGCWYSRTKCLACTKPYEGTDTAREEAHRCAPISSHGMPAVARLWWRQHWETASTALSAWTHWRDCPTSLHGQPGDVCPGAMLRASRYATVCSHMRWFVQRVQLTNITP